MFSLATDNSMRKTMQLEFKITSQIIFAYEVLTSPLINTQSSAWTALWLGSPTSHEANGTLDWSLHSNSIWVLRSLKPVHSSSVFTENSDADYYLATLYRGDFCLFYNNTIKNAFQLKANDRNLQYPSCVMAKLCSSVLRILNRSPPSRIHASRASIHVRLLRWSR